VTEFGNVQGRAKILSNIGTLLLRKVEYDKSIYHYKEAEYLFNETGDIAGLSRILLNLAIAHNMKGIKEEAMQYALNALEYLDVLGDKYRSRIAKELI
jgi:tetratricopeptide (TPR) repeat protein